MVLDSIVVTTLEPGGEKVIMTLKRQKGVFWEAGMVCIFIRVVVTKV